MVYKGLPREKRQEDAEVYCGTGLSFRPTIVIMPSATCVLGSPYESDSLPGPLGTNAHYQTHIGASGSLC